MLLQQQEEQFRERRYIGLDWLYPGFLFQQSTCRTGEVQANSSSCLYQIRKYVFDVETWHLKFYWRITTNFWKEFLKLDFFFLALCFLVSDVKQSYKLLGKLQTLHIAKCKVQEYKFCCQENKLIIFF